MRTAKTRTRTFFHGVTGVLATTGLLSACGNDNPPTEYTVGGTVSGLSGAGLVLANNGTNNLAVAANGTFTFTTALASNAPYAVTVQTQPGGQDCAVTNGTGIVGTANVVDVEVTCGPAPLILVSANPATAATDVTRNIAPTLTFSAPLDASTVTAGNVTLQSATGSHAAIASVLDATVTVTPDRKLLPLTTYTVTAGTEVQGSGGEQLAIAATTSFQTRDGAWQAPEFRDAIGDMLDPVIRFDANGNAIAVWLVWQEDDDTQTASIWSNRYTANAGWGTAELIEASMGTAQAPSLAVDAGGNAIAVWARDDEDGTQSSIWSNRYTANAGWGTAELIETNAGSAGGASLAVDASGNAIAAWAQSDGVRSNIWSNRYTADAGWGTAQLIETDNASNALSPSVAMDAGGNAVAVWSQSDGMRFNAWSNRYTANVGWGTAQLIETDDTDSAWFPQVAMDANGNSLAVWRQSDGVRNNVWSNRYAANAGWGTAVPIETDNESSAYSLSLAMNASGNAVAMWTQYDGTQAFTWSNHYTANVGWGTAAQMEADDADASPVLNYAIAMDASGNAIALWRHFGGIWSSRYTASGGWGIPALVIADDTGDGTPWYPAVAVNASGDALAIWLSYNWEEDWATHRFYSRRFE